MIDPKDLRIGNYIEYDKRIFEIYSLAYQFPTLDTIEFGIGVVDYNNIQHIELTEEWLEKLGFDKQLYGDDLFINKRSQVCKIKDKWVYRVPGYTLCHVNYIHQLQNLIYFITGQELTLKS